MNTDTATHQVSITKGNPREIGTNKDGTTKYVARWHYICTCGERGDDSTAEYAQRTGLIHQGGVGQAVRSPQRFTRDPNAPVIVLTLVCGHERHDRTEYPGRFLALKEAWCESCHTFLAVKHASKVD